MTPWLDGERPFVIAEVGVNHNGSVEMAEELVVAAAEAGASAVKFQTFRTDAIVTADADTAGYQQASTGVANQAALLRGLELPAAAWPRLASVASELGVGFMSTAFDDESLALIDRLDPVAHKIPSGEITHHRYLRAVAGLGRPVILSTGMATEAEIASAIAVLGADNPVCLLHCVSAYPTPLPEANLATIPYLRDRFGLAVGWSDHTLGEVAGIAAVALGAAVVERHITLDRAAPGPDHSVSLEPDSFRRWVDDLRACATAIGHPTELAPAEADNVVLVRRSWYAASDLPAGTRLEEANVLALRPLVGVPVDVELVGEVLARPVRRGQPITPEDLAPSSVVTGGSGGTSGS